MRVPLPAGGAPARTPTARSSCARPAADDSDRDELTAARTVKDGALRALAENLGGPWEIRVTPTPDALGRALDTNHALITYRTYVRKDPDTGDKTTRKVISVAY